MILCISDSVTPTPAIKSEPHPRESGSGYFFRSYQGCTAPCWGGWLELELLSTCSIHRGLIPYLGTTPIEPFGSEVFMCQCEKPGCPLFLPQLTKMRSGNLNLHLNLHVCHLMPRSTICKINNPPVPLDLPDGCC